MLDSKVVTLLLQKFLWDWELLNNDSKTLKDQKSAFLLCYVDSNNFHHYMIFLVLLFKAESKENVKF